MPQVRVIYGTYGHLNAARDNAVLLPSHYMANLHGYEWLIGSDRALNPSQLLRVATELFGNGQQCGKTYTEPHDEPLDSMTTIIDKAPVALRLLVEGFALATLNARTLPCGCRSAG